MTKDDEIKLIDRIVAVVQEHQATTKWSNNNYGVGALSDFLVQWRDAVNNDLPIECAHNVKVAAEMHRDQLLLTTKVETERIKREAEAEAKTLRERISREKQIASNAALKAHQALSSF